jgi:dCTP deaminase
MAGTRFQGQSDVPFTLQFDANGILPDRMIAAMADAGLILPAYPFVESQIQPASLDLRLGDIAYRVRASFLPGPGATVAERIDELKLHEIDLTDGAVLETNCVYIVPLLESLALPPQIVASANPKSSTGRLDVFTRLIADNSEVFDAVPGGYTGKLYTEISPCSFSIRARRGSKLNQIRFRRRNPAQPEKTTKFTLSDNDLRERHKTSPLVDGDIQVRNGVILSVDLKGEHPSDFVGYRAQKFTGVIDVDQIAEYDPRDFWEQVHVRNYKKLILDPNQFYILASRERIHIPPDLAAEMVPIDPMMGEFRVHYAGFFDPGFGFTEHGHPGSRAVLEVRSHEVPFILEDGQAIGRLVYEPVAETPDILYGQIDTSNYQGQGLKLSKHFRV